MNSFRCNEIIMPGFNPSFTIQGQVFVLLLKNIQNFVKFIEERRPPGEHARRYNSLLSDDIGILMPNDNTHNRDIVLHYRNSILVCISELR